MIPLIAEVGDECDNEWGEESDADREDVDVDDDDSLRCTVAVSAKVCVLKVSIMSY